MLATAITAIGLVIAMLAGVWALLTLIALAIGATFIVARANASAELRAPAPSGELARSNCGAAKLPPDGPFSCLRCRLSTG